MNKFHTTTLLTLMFSAAGWTGIAHAGGIVSDIVTQTAPLVVSATGKATVSLVAEQGLVAGVYESGKPIATGEAKASAGSVAYRWTPGTGDVSQADSVSKNISIKGTGSQENSIQVTLVPAADIGGESDGGSGWIVPTRQNTSDIKLNVEASQHQVISPDTYKMSIDAAVWGY